MPILRVGELYHPDRRSWPETTQFNFRSGQYELLLFFRSPTPDEVEAVRSGRARIGALYLDSVILLVFRFGDLPWMDAPYSWHMVSAEERTVPDRSVGEQRILLPVVLVDADTGLILVLRALTLSPRVSKALIDAILDQSARTFAPAAYDKALASIYQRHSSQDLSALAVMDLAGE